MLNTYATYTIGHTECIVGRTYAEENKVDLLKAEKLLSRKMFSNWFDNSIKKKVTGAPIDLENYSISNSHSHGWVCIARCNTFGIGIDIQTLSSKCESVKNKFIGKGDVNQPANVSNIQYYSLIWSLKEAAYKWHEEYIALKDINITKLENGCADIILHSDMGTLDCKAYYMFSDNWVLSVVEK
jgi:phosphopantetheinyl transferase